MKNKWFGLLLFCLPVISVANVVEYIYYEQPKNILPDTSQLTVPLGGNSWLTVAAPNGSEKVTDQGWQNWQHPEAVFSTYIWINKPGELKITAWLNVPDGKSTIQCSVNGKKNTFTANGATDAAYKAGTFLIKQPGYVRIDMQGLKRSGNVFARIAELRIAGTAVDTGTAFVKNNDDNYFYWGRRGPSVHLNYTASDPGNEVEWFYSEITVPEGNDPVGSYFMANGFGEGYFGIQVNSPQERRILFSVWSPFHTDDPAAIPEDKKIKLLKKGEDVHTGEFGNEGAGGQSYLRYPWKAGQTYGFLLHGQPTENNTTDYTAYFYAPELKQWLLIASFRRPATNTWLKRLHGFLENFDPSKGNVVRMAWYHNQWVRNKEGQWKALGKMLFTGDATAQKQYRLDYAGGAGKQGFYLRNGGFFSDRTTLRSTFEQALPAQQPDIDLSQLK